MTKTLTDAQVTVAANIYSFLATLTGDELATLLASGSTPAAFANVATEYKVAMSLFQKTSALTVI